MGRVVAGEAHWVGCGDGCGGVFRGMGRGG